MVDETGMDGKYDNVVLESEWTHWAAFVKNKKTNKKCEHLIISN